MGQLIQLHSQQGQSPWLDNLKRSWLSDGGIQRWVDRGVRGITSNPSIFQKAIADSDDYTEQLSSLVRGGASTEHAYWEMVVADIEAALEILRPTYDASNGGDGFVSVEVSPALARDTSATMEAARWLWDRIERPNLYVKIPGTVEGLPAIEEMIAEERNINVTLIFSLERYDSVIESYIRGLERAAEDGADLSRISSVASFFISRVDSEVDRRLEAIGTQEALELRGRAAVAQGQMAFRLATERFSGPRWEALADKGARIQRPLWASTSTKNPAYPDTLYVDTLIGPDTVNTLPDGTLEAFDDHGTPERTIDADPEGLTRTWDAIGNLVDMEDVSTVLENEGVASFEKSFDELLAVLERRAAELD